MLKLLFSIHICTKHLFVENKTHHIDPSLSSLEEFGSFKDFTAIYINIDNADPMLLYLDQTPAKYLHLSCNFSPSVPVMVLVYCPFSSHIQVHLLHLTKTILSLCDKHISANFSGYCCLIWQATDQRMARKTTKMDLSSEDLSHDVHTSLFLSDEGF